LAKFSYERRGERGADTYLSELIWREFYQMLLANHPHLAAGGCFKPVFDKLVFGNDPERFKKWTQGQTGYPLVDAGMRQLYETGFMHNRLRMITASFLIKDLDVDWRWGEQYFARLLLDFDLSANNGGWQWAASTGCDAQPWFRIFNPVTQSERFDPKGSFIRRYLPELSMVPDQFIHQPWKMNTAQQHQHHCHIGSDYPSPLVDHAQARVLALQRYGVLHHRI
jgi:deoxyribodipyrimidine photo-lyase